jgi:hypothetical protein
MLTPEVDGGAPSPGALWLTVGELADAHGVSRQSIHQVLQRWLTAGSPVTTRRNGAGQVEVDVAEYDKVRGEHVDLVIGREHRAENRSGVALSVVGRRRRRSGENTALLVSLCAFQVNERPAAERANASGSSGTPSGERAVAVRFGQRAEIPRSPWPASPEWSRAAAAAGLELKAHSHILRHPCG